MKRTFRTLLVLVVCGLALTGCFPTEQTPSESPSSPSKESTEEASTTMLQGEKVQYSVSYDSQLWERSNDTGNEDAEFELRHVEQDTYGMIIAERPKFGLDNLRDIAIENMDAVGEDREIIAEEKRVIDGKEMVELQVNLSIDGFPVTYFSRYYSGEEGSIQFITFTYQNLFEERKAAMADLLDSLVIAENPDITAPSADYSGIAGSYEQGVILEADYSEGYKAGYVDGRAQSGQWADSYSAPATEARKNAYLDGYREGFILGCWEGGFEDCDEFEEAQMGELELQEGEVTTQT